MTVINLTDEMIARLKMLARKTPPDETEDGEFNDEFNPMDQFGGNFDDAYSGGVRTGEIAMAREVLIAAGIEW